MWVELARRFQPEARAAIPASNAVVEEAEEALGIQFPPDLRALLEESDGLVDEYGAGIWSVARLLEANLQLREDSRASDLYMTFDNLLLIADAGNGDLFAYPIQGDGAINRPDIFLWDHETDSRQWVAGSLQQFVERWFGGELQR
jgi:hypothetical protein